ncbi:hypothetical protein I316_04040 [Kwoniella heveanensis BCC8398]|uniref:Uncharacterized protein n=1 Tax=Kwoniella heveanensis BCC8398 TaxID=1296120 RepID=A0A1B9GSV7_9TREE|nr:hypothetical protein I316_04040 [Kwoniella heveanensis BCC8398]
MTTDIQPIDMAANQDRENGMPPDLLVIVGQLLASKGHKKTLFNLSLTSRDNFRLLTPILYRHLNLTDRSAPKLFRHFLTFHKDVRFLFFASIDEGVDIANSGCHPIIRLRKYLTFVHKITVDTPYDEPKVFNVLAGWAKGLRELCQDTVFPNVKRMVLTARSGTKKHLRMVGMDDRRHCLLTFLPLACDPQHICFTPAPPVPIPRRNMPELFGAGPAAFAITFDDGVIPQWARRTNGRHSTKSSTSIKSPTDMEVKMSKLVGTSLRTRPDSTLITLEDMSPGQMTIVDRAGQASRFEGKLNEIIQSTVSVVLNSPIPSAEQLHLKITPSETIRKLKEAITLSNNAAPCEACGGEQTVDSSVKLG